LPKTTFSHTVIGSTSMKCWWIMPTPASIDCRARRVERLRLAVVEEDGPSVGS